MNGQRTEFSNLASAGAGEVTYTNTWSRCVGVASRISCRNNGGNRNVFRLRMGAVKNEITRYALARGVMNRVTSFAAAASRRYRFGYETTALVRQCWLSMDMTGSFFRCPTWQVSGSKSVMTR